MTTDTAPTLPQLIAANSAARALLTHALHTTPDSLTATVAIETISSTAPVCPEESISTLQTCMTDEMIESHGFEYLPAMMRHLSSIAEADEAFALQLVEIISMPRGTRDDLVPSRGRIISLSFNKHDLWGMSYTHLEQQFERLIHTKPLLGTRIWIAIVDAHIESKHVSREDALSFSFLEGQAVCTPDYSNVWASNDQLVRHDTWHKLSIIFKQFLIRQSGSSPDSTNAILGAIRDHGRWAYYWSQLLIACSESPATLAYPLMDVLCQPALLALFDCYRAAHICLAASHAILDNTSRCLIENALLTFINATQDNPDTSYGNRAQNLLAAIPQVLLSSEQSQLYVISNREQHTTHHGTSESDVLPTRVISNEEWLGTQGVDLSAIPNQEFHSALQTLRTDCMVQEALSNENSAKNWLSQLQGFELLLERAPSSGVASQLYETAEDYLFGCCEIATTSTNLRHYHEVHDYVTSTLLRAAEDIRPVHRPEDDEKWDESSPAWGSLIPRITAAQGLMNLARHSDTINDDILSAINQLADDPVPSVRYQIAHDLLALLETSEEDFWTLVKGFAHNEQRLAILHTLVTDVFLVLPFAHIERTSSLIHALYLRIRDNPRSSSVRQVCALFYFRHAFRNEYGPAHSFVEATIENAADHTDELRQVLLSCRELMCLDDKEMTVEENQRIRIYSLDIVARSFQAISAEFLSLQERYLSEGLPDNDIHALQQLAALQDVIAHQVFFASGAFDDKELVSSDEEQEQKAALRTRFSSEGAAVLEEMSRTRLSNVAYTLLRTLQHLRETDPVHIFLLIHQVVRSAMQDGFQLESLAADAVVECVEQYLAEQRSLFRDNSQMINALMDLLDIFVEAGWPKAMLLTYRLDEVMRG